MKTRLSIAAITVLVGIGSASLWLVPQIVSLEQWLGLRWLANLRGPLPAPQEVVLIAMNSKAAANISLPKQADKFHRCENIAVGEISRTHVTLPGIPARWPRCMHTRLIDKLLR